MQVTENRTNEIYYEKKKNITSYEVSAFEIIDGHLLESFGRGAISQSMSEDEVLDIENRIKAETIRRLGYQIEIHKLKK